MSKRGWLVAFGSTALGLLGIGCGGSNESATVSKADFISGGDKICVDTVRKQASVYEEIVSESKGTEISAADGKAAEQELADGVASSIEEMIDEFEELGAPAGKEEEVATMLEEYENGAEESRADPRAFLTAEAFAAADAKAKELGLTKCDGI